VHNDVCIQGLICAGTAQYRVPPLILEVVHHTASSCCLNGSTLSICEVENV